MKQAHVICCNDSVEFVCFGLKDEAEITMLGLRDHHFRRYDIKNRTDYDNQYYWHIHTVESNMPEDGS